MKKILYAASASKESYLQLCRTLIPLSNSFEVRIAGYRNYLDGVDADYTLDSLFDFYGRDASKPVRSKVFERYCKEISTYNPDLIISDFDFFTSLAAVDLGIPYWIVSSFALWFGLDLKIKNKLNCFKRHGSVFRHLKNHHRYGYQIENAEKIFVYSFLGDAQSAPLLMDNFYYVRPYHVDAVAKNSKNVTVVISEVNKNLLNYVKPIDGNVAYSLVESEIPTVKSINHNSYPIDLVNSYFSISTGETTFISDAVYNKIYPIVYPDYRSKTSILNSAVLEHYGIGTVISTTKSYQEINDLVDKELHPSLSLKEEINHLDSYIKDRFS